jgi:hypothetical protein
VRKTAFQTFVAFYIENMASGTMFTVDGLYTKFRDFLQSGAPPGSLEGMEKFLQMLREVTSRGDLPNEKRYKNDIRWAIRDAKDRSLIRHHGTPRSGEWRRT